MRPDFGGSHTIVSLKALKDSDRLPVLWLVRSLKLAYHIASECFKLDLSVLISAGRDRACIVEKNVDRDFYCKYRRFQCPFFRNVFKTRIPKINIFMDYNMLVEGARSEGFCPYYMEDLVDADITVQNYFRARRKYFKAIAIDEVHNIFMPREICFPFDDLNTVHTIINLNLDKSVGRIFERFLRAIRYSKTIVVEEYFDSIFLDELKGLMYQYVEDKRVSRILGRFLRLMQYNTVLNIERERIIGYKPLLPIQTFPQTIMLTGTWFNTMDKFLPSSFEKISVDFSNDKPEAMILEDLTTRYNDFDYKMIEEYRKFIVQMKLKARDKRILIFGSERVLQYFINLADLYEPTQIPKNWRGIMMLKARGRYAEGVDIPADIVVILGCPFLPPEVISRLSKIYSRMGFEDSWSLAATIPMLITTLQCIGRARRDPKQRPKIILADERYGKYVDELSNYLYIGEIDV